jgi:hypothetical protein
MTVKCIDDTQSNGILIKNKMYKIRGNGHLAGLPVYRIEGIPNHQWYFHRFEVIKLNPNIKIL